MGPFVTGRWDSLSLELWVNILCRLKDNFDATCAWEKYTYREDFVQSLRNIQRLRLVCTKFNTALDDPQLSRCVLMRKGFQSKHLPSLVRWLHHHGRTVQLFTATGGTPSLEAALAAVVFPGSQLSFASITDASTAAIHLLSCHSMLHSIDIGSQAVTRLDLQPLAALPFLGKLILTAGQFTCAEPLLHLTGLHLSNASLTFSDGCFCASKVLKLNVRGGQLHVNGQGLAACHTLKKLTLSNCSVGAQDAEDCLTMLPEQATHIPSVLVAGDSDGLRTVLVS
ncbi:hypothetical protein ABBQ38_002553 [Trebouxia sp. C0009 RCD-2024]